MFILTISIKKINKNIDFTLLIKPRQLPLSNEVIKYIRDNDKNKSLTNDKTSLS